MGVVEVLGTLNLETGDTLKMCTVVSKTGFSYDTLT